MTWDVGRGAHLVRNATDDVAGVALELRDNGGVRQRVLPGDELAHPFDA